MTKLLDPFRFVLVAVAGWMNQQQLSAIEYLREENGSGAKFVNGAVRLRICDISVQAANTAFQSSGIVIERRPSLPVLN